jgi:hypothetical protein
MASDPINTPITATGETGAAPSSTSPKSIYLISYPKVIFLYPSLLAAIVCGLIVLFYGNEDRIGQADQAPAAQAAGNEAAEGAAGEAADAKADDEAAAVKDRNTPAELTTLVFLCILGVNLVVLSFDFPRTTSLTFFFVAVAIFLGLWLLSSRYPGMLPVIGSVVTNLRPFANAQFFGIFAGFMALIYLAVLVTVQFDYWEVRPNELLHHHGLLSDLKRYAAPSLRIDKEINDLFEYMLLRSGRLILHPSSEPRAIVLENVFFINRKEEQITRMLGALQVQVRTENPT